MAHGRPATTFAILLLVVAGLAGCKRSKGSCDRRAGIDKTCTEILKSTSDSTKRACADDPIKKGTWGDDPCPRESAIAACETTYERTWYYPGASAGRITKLEHVAAVCGGGKMVDAKGKQLEGVKPEALGDPTVSDTSAIADPKKLDAMLAALGKIRLPAGAPSGTIKPTGGKTLKYPAATIYESDLAAIGLAVPGGSTEKYSLSDSNRVRSCATVAKMKNRLDSYLSPESKRDLAWCPTVECVLVVRLSKLDDVNQRDSTYFKGGTAEGDVFVYELPSATLIGGYSWKATSSEKSKSEDIVKDFRANIAKALNAGLKNASPTATVTFSL